MIGSNMLTQRENFLRVVNGEQPEWVPVYIDAVDLVVPSVIGSHMATVDKVDFMGIKWIVSDGAATVHPKSERMEDISDWKDRIKFPDLEAINWKEVVAADTKGYRDDTVKAVKLTYPGQVFLPLANLMGFEDALCSLLIEPDEVKEFNEALTVFLEGMIKKTIEFYRPDIIIIGEDFASAADLFFSTEIFYEFYLPSYKRMCDLCLDAGTIVEYHLCGKVDRVIDDVIDLGVNIWQAAQVMNDIDGIKARHKNLAFNGLYDNNVRGALPGSTEEEARQSVRDCMDRYGKDGKLMFFDGLFGVSDEAIQRMGWIRDEARIYGKELYK